jgi:hypothetical protein
VVRQGRSGPWLDPCPCRLTLPTWHTVGFLITKVSNRVSTEVTTDTYRQRTLPAREMAVSRREEVGTVRLDQVPRAGLMWKAPLARARRGLGVH